MSIALESGGNRIERSRFIGGISSRIPVFESPESGREFSAALPDDRRCAGQAANLEPKDEDDSASCSSSLGRNSDMSEKSQSDDDGDEEAEVQSSYKGPLSTMDALEDSLPIRRGISKFYCGKSKSFTTLADAACISVKELAKPENLYNRKRKNLLARNNFFDRNQHSHLRHSWEEGISKRPANSSRSALALSTAGSSSDSNTSEESESCGLPPLHPQRKASLSTASSYHHHHLKRPFSSRSFSLTDLHTATTGSSMGPS